MQNGFARGRAPHRGAAGVPNRIPRIQQFRRDIATGFARRGVSRGASRETARRAARSDFPAQAPRGRKISAARVRSRARGRAVAVPPVESDAPTASGAHPTGGVACLRARRVGGARCRAGHTVRCGGWRSGGGAPGEDRRGEGGATMSGAPRHARGAGPAPGYAEASAPPSRVPGSSAAPSRSRAGVAEGGLAALPEMGAMADAGGAAHAPAPPPRRSQSAGAPTPSSAGGSKMLRRTSSDGPALRRAGSSGAKLNTSPASARPWGANVPRRTTPSSAHSLTSSPGSRKGVGASTAKMLPARAGDGTTLGVSARKKPMPEPRNASVVERTTERDLVRLRIEYDRVLTEQRSRLRDLDTSEGELRMLEGMKPETAGGLSTQRDELQKRLDACAESYEFALFEREQLSRMIDRTSAEVRLDSADVTALREEIALASKAEKSVHVRATKARDAAVSTRADLSCAQEDLRRFEQNATAQVGALHEHAQAEEGYINGYEQRALARTHVREIARHSEEYTLKAKEAVNKIRRQTIQAEKEESRGITTKLKQAFEVFFRIAGTDDLDEMVNSLLMKGYDKERMTKESAQKEERVKQLTDEMRELRRELEHLQYSDRRSTSSKHFEVYASRMESSQKRLESLLERDAATERLLKITLSMIGQYSDKITAAASLAQPVRRITTPQGDGRTSVQGGGSGSSAGASGGPAGHAANFFGRSSAEIDEAIRQLDLDAGSDSGDGSVDTPPRLANGSSRVGRSSKRQSAAPQDFHLTSLAEFHALADTSIARGRAAAQPVAAKAVLAQEHGKGLVKGALDATDNQVVQLLATVAPSMSASGQQVSARRGSVAVDTSTTSGTQGGENAGGRDSASRSGVRRPSSVSVMSDSQRNEPKGGFATLNNAEAAAAHNNRVASADSARSALEGEVASFIFQHRERLTKMVRDHHAATTRNSTRRGRPTRMTLSVEQIEQFLREIDRVTGPLQLRDNLAEDLQIYVDAIVQLQQGTGAQRGSGAPLPNHAKGVSLSGLLQEIEQEEETLEFSDAFEHVGSKDHRMSRTRDFETRATLKERMRYLTRNVEVDT